MKVVPDSHLDHGLSEAQVEYLTSSFQERDAFFIETVELPPHLGTVECGLYGPSMGDEPVSSDVVSFARRGERDYASRVVELPPRPTRLVTVVAGPWRDEPCVLYTAFGGPAAPKEASDPSLQKEEAGASLEFWRQHALALTRPADAPRTTDLAAEYTTTPGGRYRKDGPYSGEEFREAVLIPRFEAGGQWVHTVVLSGEVEGYPAGFLEEVFGGFARKYSPAVAWRLLNIQCADRHLRQEVYGYMAAAEAQASSDDEASN